MMQVLIMIIILTQRMNLWVAMHELVKRDQVSIVHRSIRLWHSYSFNGNQNSQDTGSFRGACRDSPQNRCLDIFLFPVLSVSEFHRNSCFPWFHSVFALHLMVCRMSVHLELFVRIVWKIDIWIIFFFSCLVILNFIKILIFPHFSPSLGSGQVLSQS